ncbi:isocitrate lyase/PEP mutase family protein [Actinoallomurus rhizosphaericola]|uniref:isocitrate lyase/PEP mutase family protein n=1 Tax=Actinoallomurus rhizosphaericola TaxID=2952536 RepID=UPI00209237EA|nr:isocitrate lyase/phosphoenolpyruvate mutase family protein [Actinoallomurus rhizosphaericola]MCO5998963.1 isocitrate lyase/phosphoenolpyruvate mutase family protein [Actinoallomurus rhizosphaericola]
MDLPGKKALLRALHEKHPDDRGLPLILPNAWDAVSARVLVDAGFAAIATASAAVSASLGYGDGEAAPYAEMFAAAGRVTRAVDVPVSVDAEAGYGLPPAELADRLREAGAAGCNLEDTAHGAPGAGRVLADVAAQAERIAALRDADGELFINARVDVYATAALPDASDAERLEEAAGRARAYVDAGADGVFVIAVSDEKAIAELADRIPAPLNVLYRPGMPSLARLGELGVRRVTFGPGLQRATLTLLAGLAGRLHAGETPDL